jgi:hypothetical protein
MRTEGQPNQRCRSAPLVAGLPSMQLRSCKASAGHPEYCRVGTWWYAMHVPVTARISMDPENTIPAATCLREPLRKEIDTVPESSPRVPAQI